MNCPIGFFSQSDRVYGAPVSFHPIFRKSQTVPQKALDMLLAGFSVRLFHSTTLLRTIELEPLLPLPKYDLDDYNGDVEAVANNIRRAWYAPAGPIDPLVEYVEKTGCLIFMCNMKEARVDGASYFHSANHPIIMLNENLPADRMRFTLAHELGHIVLRHDQFPTPEIDQEAHRFAAALLMPKKDILPHLRNLTLEKAAAMKPHWKTSMAALIRRARDLGQISQTQYNTLWRKMTQLGYRLQEPEGLDFKAERPVPVNQFFKYFKDDLEYTREDMEATFHLQYEELAQLYGFESPPSLRLIKA